TTVTMAPFSGRGVPVNGFERSALNKVAVATFTHANGVEPGASFTATVAWGDGTSSSGQVRQESDGSYTVTGSHTYGDERTYPITVSVSDAFSSTTITTTATILEELLPDGTRGTADQRFISEVYRDLLGRKVDTGGLAGWSAMLDQGISRFAVVRMIQDGPTNEFRKIEVEELYERYLHRAAD